MQELVNQGTDTMIASVSFSIAGDGAVERLSLSGRGNIDGNGNALANILTSNSGRNMLDGSSGNDTLTGGAGSDLFTGGAGADRFVFLAAAESGTMASTRDVLYDFVHGTDRIDLSAIDANTVSSGDHAFVLDARGSASTAVAHGHIGWYQENHAGTADERTILRTNVDNDSAIEATIELHGLVSLAKEDFPALTSR